MPLVPIPALKDCEFSAFISYAHADDEAWFGWVTQFRNELERGLAALLRGVKVPRAHLSGNNGPVAGVLSDELKERIAASFAMIIVVHDNYAQSDWCLRELEYFHAMFGDEGLRERLYIVAMGESAMLAVSGGSTWQRLLPGGEQIWVPFFEEQDHNRPREVYLAPGLVSPAFRVPFERLRSHLAGKLKVSVGAGVGASPPPAAPPAPASASAAPGPGGKALGHPPVASERVLFGFVAPGAMAATAEAVKQLAARGVPARLLGQDAVFSEFADFDHAEHLVLAFDGSAPMLTTLAPGGHLQLQRDAWIKRKRPAAHVHWLELLPGAPPRPDVQALVAAAPSPPLALPALLDRLAPARVNALAPAHAVRIYIESNRHERTLWEPLGVQIQHQWEAVCRRIAPDRVPPLNLRARGLPVDQIDAFPSLDDADGVVLLWGKKTSEALVAQINKVELKLAPGRDTAPGIVAYLMPPQASTEPVPAWGWQVLRFDARDETTIDVIADERRELERFLEKVFRRHQQRLGVAP
jgi:hypothetical protein